MFHNKEMKQINNIRNYFNNFYDNLRLRILRTYISKFINGYFRNQCCLPLQVIFFLTQIN